MYKIENMKTMISGYKFMLLSLIAFQIFSPFAFSQSPEKMSYQAVIRDSDGKLVVDQLTGIRIQIKQGSEFGAAVYVETYNTKTNSNGLVTLEVGGGTIVSGSFADIDWENGPYFLQTETDPAGGSNYTINGVFQLLTVPYAFHAETAKYVPGTATEVALNELDMKVTALENDTSAEVAIEELETKVTALENDTSTEASIDALEEKVAAMENLLKEAGIYIYQDIDGNSYHTVKIGNQVWMKENLKVTHYRNGDPILKITNGDIWKNASTGAYGDFDNTSGNCTIYGKLYNFYTVVDPRNLCPAGWHVPSNYEWITLVNYLGGESIAGGKMKVPGTVIWQNPNTGATNESGFTALPTGGISSDGEFTSFGFAAGFWTSTYNGGNWSGLSWVAGYYSTSFLEGGANSGCGSAVRCIKD